MDKLFQVALLVAVLTIPGCAAKKEKIAVGVAEKCRFAPLPKACKRSIPALKSVPMAKYERNALRDIQSLSPQDRNEFIAQQQQRISDLLGHIIRNRQESADVRRNARLCRAHTLRIRRLCR